MDKAIFQFNSPEYLSDDVKNLSRSMCEKLCETDENNVIKFDIENENLENLLNEGIIDTDNCWFRVFM